MKTKLQLAEEAADILLESVKAAHRVADNGEAFLEVLLLDVISDTAKLRNKIVMICGAEQRNNNN